MGVVQSCGKVSGACTQVCEEWDFLTFYSIDDGHGFIIVFEASNPINDSREKFHRESIKYTEFCDNKRFCRIIFH